ncbi:MAG: hypothetical protein LBI14_09150 [Treponema sp.]|jgi:hypothetical protein|nr:hypothetical protein [Treponema sp.]
MKRRFFFATVFVMAILLPLSAQSFGFGFDDEAETSYSTGFAPSVTISGEVSASLMGYVHDFTKGINKVELGNIFSGKLNFSAGVSFADAFISLKLKPFETSSVIIAPPDTKLTFSTSPVSIDEAYVRAFFGGFEVEGGLRKLSWGKADSFGPLDVVNPLDYSELTDLSSMLNFKIARPMVHLSYRFGSFSKIEAVFVPWFEPLRYDMEGRWIPAQMEQLKDQLAVQASGIPFDITINKPNASLYYAQAGIRFTTSIGPADIGIQYYYGRLTRPALPTVTTVPTMPPVPPTPPLPSKLDFFIDFAYNPYHQIGIDWAQVLFGFNIRAEFAVNITEDLKGDDGGVYNPHLAWALGFDRNLFWGINLNLQCNETVRLMHNKITSPLDTEAGSDMTSTQIIAAISKTFLNDQLELRVAAFWEIEAKDFMIIPSLIWTKDAVTVELSGGIFGGDKAGQFGQYWENSFVKVALKYSF